MGADYRVYPSRLSCGGLTADGPDTIDLYRRAAGYVDRILKGEKPAHLPVQAATKYATIINLKTAKALGFGIPPALFARGRRGHRVVERRRVAPLLHLLTAAYDAVDGSSTGT